VIRPGVACVVAAAALGCLGGSAAASPRTYTGWVQEASGRTHHVYEGDRFQVVFSSRRGVRYRVCVVRRGGYYDACWSRNAAAGQSSRIDLTLAFIDAPGGWEATFGNYVATWSVAGKHVAVWRFTWRPAG
jgi:hypothetical protein